MLGVALVGCGGEVPEPAALNAALARGEPIALCDATLQVRHGLVIVEQPISPEPLALAGFALVGSLILLGLVVLGLFHLRRTAPVIAVLMLLAAGFSVFVGTDRVTFDRARRQVHLTEGWFLDLYQSHRRLDYSPAMTLYANEADEEESHWMRIWLRTAEERSMRLVECRATVWTETRLREGLPSLAAALEDHAGLRSRP